MAHEIFEITKPDNLDALADYLDDCYGPQLVVCPQILGPT